MAYRDYLQIRSVQPEIHRIFVEIHRILVELVGLDCEIEMLSKNARPFLFFVTRCFFMSHACTLEITSLCHRMTHDSRENQRQHDHEDHPSF